MHTSLVELRTGESHVWVYELVSRMGGRRIFCTLRKVRSQKNKIILGCQVTAVSRDCQHLFSVYVFVMAAGDCVGR